MCGIIQVFSRREEIHRENFKNALHSMKHRGPDYTGTHFHSKPFIQPDGTPVFVASGHQRLAILDLCERSNQPFRRADSTLVFNGEIYNFQQLRTEIPTSGAEFTTNGDTEVLFYGLGWKGLDFIQNANGMWAFTYFDEERMRVLACRDRHGKKPLFYYADDDHVIFSSTVAAIHRYLGTRPQLDPDFTDSYLAHGWAFPGSNEHTHWRGIRQVPSGHYLDFDLAAWSLRLDRYYDIEEAAKMPAPDDAGLLELMKDAVQARLTSDRKVGLLLSGGIDSTIILSTLYAMGLHDGVHCFIGETGRSEDALYARRCVEKLGIEATVIDLDYGKQTFDRVLAMCRHHEKPFPFVGSSIAMAEMFEQIALRDVRVVLDGTGGDEIFGGYWGRYFPSAVREAIFNRDDAWLEGIRENCPDVRSVIAREKLRLATKGVLGSQRFKAWKQRNSPAKRLLGLNRAQIEPNDPLATMKAGFAATSLRDVMPGGQLGEWIWHNDRNSMMWGIEGRSPLLDYRLVPFMSNGYAMKFHNQWNKYQLRRLFDALTPLPTQWRQQKQGFRWNSKAFVSDNSARILETIATSVYLNGRYDIPTYVNRASRNRKVLLSGITPRLFCIAGLESELGVAPS